MKYFKSIIPMLAVVLVTSCSNKNSDQNTSEPGMEKKFTTAAAAASAAKEDMMSAMGSVDFGVDKEKLRSSAPGAAIAKYDVNWDALLNADTSADLKGMVKDEPVTIVPLVSGSDVVTVIALKGGGNQFSIGAIGDKQIATELDMVQKVSGPAEVSIFEVPNIGAIVYAVSNAAGSKYYTSYNNNSLREGMDAVSLTRMLKADAQSFNKLHGDEVKKGKIVR